MNEFKVIITGSRTWEDYGRIYRRLAALADADREGQQVVVIHGDAPGADRLADRAARELGYSIRKYPADWKLGKLAGKERNSLMLRCEQPNIVLAFWKDGSEGTGDMVEKVLDSGTYIEIHEQ